MNSSIIINAVLLVLLVLLSGFFSSAETAMTTVSRIHIQARASSGDKRAVLLLKVLDNSQQMLSTILIGNNLVNMAASALATSLTIDVLGNAYIGLSTGVLTLLILIFGEITPKSLANVEAEKYALRYCGAIRLLMTVLNPVAWFVDHLSRGIMLFLNVDPDARTNPVTPKEIRTMVDAGEQEGMIENEEKEMINNVFDLGDSFAKDIMIPRIDMVFVEVNETYENLLAIFRDCMHTRYPVYDGNTDNVIGTINIKDLLTLPQGEEFSIRNILREAYFTYEFKNTSELLLEMRRASVSIAIVLDEYGSTSGLVTLEDLLEEIVGEIRDEYDTNELEEIRTITEGKEYAAVGSAKLDDLNEKLSIDLSSDDNDSIGGYIIEKLDRMPRIGDSVETPSGIRLTVEAARKNRIELVHIKMPDET